MMHRRRVEWMRGRAHDDAYSCPGGYNFAIEEFNLLVNVLADFSEDGVQRCIRRERECLQRVYDDIMWMERTHICPSAIIYSDIEARKQHLALLHQILAGSEKLPRDSCYWGPANMDELIEVQLAHEFGDKYPIWLERYADELDGSRNL